MWGGTTSHMHQMAFYFKRHRFILLNLNLTLMTLELKLCLDSTNAKMMQLKKLKRFLSQGVQKLQPQQADRQTKLKTLPSHIHRW